MKRAVVIAPGRGVYNKPELGYLATHHKGHPLMSLFDASRGSDEPITMLDSAQRFNLGKYTRGDVASPLIYTCSLLDFLSLDIEVVGVTGNSMGWYTSLACAGVVSPEDGFKIVNTMGSLMQEHLIGGQLIYPFFDQNWREKPGMREKIFSKADEINERKDHVLTLSIDLGGMLVLAGNSAGLDAFEDEMPKIDARFPMRLPNHAAFHTKLQSPVANLGRETLSEINFNQPKLPLIDGRGALWYPNACDTEAMREYTFGHQIVQPYDYTTAVRVAARELMPDLFVVLGPGTTLGGATAQSMIRAKWRGMSDKKSFQELQKTNPVLATMGDPKQRRTLV